MMKTTGTERMKITGLSEKLILLARALTNYELLKELQKSSREIRDRHYGNIITYSRKLFLPLTNICVNKCLYCNFRRDLNDSDAYIMNPRQALEIVEKYEKKYLIKEVLICTGEKPDTYRSVRDRLKSWGYRSYIEYLRDILEKIVRKTLFATPHVNVGYLEKEEIEILRPYVASMGLMLEVDSYNVLRNGPHVFSPTKAPHYRIKFIINCNKLRVPVTSGILAGICENVIDRARTLLLFSKLCELVEALQEIIIQPYVPGDRSSYLCNCCTTPELEELIMLISLYRINIPPEISIQSPPNLVDNVITLVHSGINDLGGISPVTPDYINIRYPWPRISYLRKVLESSGYVLRERLPVYPRFIKSSRIWLSDIIREKISYIVDENGLVDPKYEGKDR